MCLPVAVEVIDDVLHQWGGDGLMGESRHRGRVSTQFGLCTIGPGVPGVVPMGGHVGPSSLASRQSPMDGDWLVGSRRKLRLAAAIACREAVTWRQEAGGET